MHLRYRKISLTFANCSSLATGTVSWSDGLDAISALLSSSQNTGAISKVQSQVLYGLLWGKLTTGRSSTIWHSSWVNSFTWNPCYNSANPWTNFASILWCKWQTLPSSWCSIFCFSVPFLIWTTVLHLEIMTWPLFCKYINA